MERSYTTALKKNCNKRFVNLPHKQVCKRLAIVRDIMSDVRNEARWMDPKRVPVAPTRNAHFKQINQMNQLQQKLKDTKNIYNQLVKSIHIVDLMQMDDNLQPSKIQNMYRSINNKINSNKRNIQLSALKL